MSNGLRIISISNQKGGVGKTTTAVNLGTALAAVEKKVLLIDLDPQGNASTSLGIPANQREINIYQMLIGQLSVSEVIKNTSVPNLDILPSGIDLAGAELELIDVDERESGALGAVVSTRKALLPARELELPTAGRVRIALLPAVS